MDTDTQIRLACLEQAVKTPGNPNHLQSAQKYYDWVTQANVEAKTEPKATEASKAVAQKGTRK